MRESLLTSRQKEVLKYRKQGLSQQQIADIISTSKANVCTIERCAMDNIRRAKEALKYYYTINSTHLCSIPAETDLFNTPALIFKEAEKHSIKVKYDSLTLINHIKSSIPYVLNGRHIQSEVGVYINSHGELFFI